LRNFSQFSRDFFGHLRTHFELLKFHLQAASQPTQSPEVVRMTPPDEGSIHVSSEVILCLFDATLEAIRGVERGK
jgi:hypothetical protein